jgi:hypothetical protein
MFFCTNPIQLLHNSNDLFLIFYISEKEKGNLHANFGCFYQVNIFERINA